MSYTSGEVFAVRDRLYAILWQETDIDSEELAYDIVDKLLANDYISDVLFQEIKEEK